MNKEEILAKSREENKNRDIAEIDNIKKASRFAVIFTLSFFCIYSLLSIFADKPMNHALTASVTGMAFSTNLHRSIKNQKSDVIICAVLTGISFLIFSFLAVCDLFDIKF
jgi:hypothetical protein